MSYDITWTEFEDFPIQYGEEFVEGLNRIFSNLKHFTNAIMKEIGRRTSPRFIHKLYGKTEDGYTWFGRLEYHLDKKRAVILFPWNKERSINVYSNEIFSYRALANLLERLINETRNFF